MRRRDSPMKSITLEIRESLLLHGVKSHDAVVRRSRFLPALKYFELGEITSGQATAMAGVSRVKFLLEAGRHGVAVADMDDEARTGFGLS
jgi:hypothetical protein